MVRDAHGEHGIETRESGEVFAAKGQDMCARLTTQSLGQCKLVQEQTCWVDAHCQLRTGFQHAKQVVTVSATDIEHAFAVKIVDVAAQSVPLPVGSPFTVDINAMDAPRTFSPRHVTLQLFRVQWLIVVWYDNTTIFHLPSGGLVARSHLSEVLTPLGLVSVWSLLVVLVQQVCQGGAMSTQCSTTDSVKELIEVDRCGVHPETGL